MKKSLALFLFIFISLVCSAQVEGNVTDSTGKAIAEALISVIDSATQKTDSVKTGSDGFFIFKKLTAGNYLVTTRAKGYEDDVIKKVMVAGELEVNSTGDISNATWLEIVLKPQKQKNN